MPTNDPGRSAPVRLAGGGTAELLWSSVRDAAETDPGHVRADVVHYARIGPDLWWPAARLIKRAMSAQGIAGELSSDNPRAALEVLNAFGVTCVQITRFKDGRPVMVTEEQKGTAGH
ncbi:hypothetical protein P3T37_004356 [Kitasatospora sp. MAA4]|uniref:hypothetical protein n=1 Tax=Kitasatospora sp. MAA4 TaxID=3035093 RepID=UPI002475AA2D|nr:hypothetical protein [Kitasatospora sp. MAA4]MDH6134947.1 hypothetical protein [Kitasatospora sp. MAA4]